MYSAMTLRTIGIIFLAVGFILKYWVNRRRFYRRNQFGVEEFKSFTRSRIISLIEGVTGAVGWLLIIVGIVVVVGSFMK